MINLEQIQELGKKINNAVELINRLKEENKTLKTVIEKSKGRMTELEKLVTDFKNDQSEIEQTILNAIDKLDRLEDEISESENTVSDSSLADDDESEKKTAGDSYPQETDKQQEEKKKNSAESPDQTEKTQNEELDIF